MNGLKAPSIELLTALGQEMTNIAESCDVAVFPPATLLAPLSGLCELYGIILGGQDCHFEEKGAFTGDISPEMLKDSGCRYVILGHSERRCYHNETSLMVKRKAEAALKAGLAAIICIGETSEQCESGQTFSVLEEQIVESIPEDATSESVIIAYEPVWAIGTGKTPTIGEIQKNHDFIYKTLLKQFEKTFRILYGGSVKATNAREFLNTPHVNGLLVGGASLDKDEFSGIIRVCNQLSFVS